jgi:hypothetical protein
MTAIPGLNRRRMLAASTAGLTMAATPRAFGQSAYKAKAETYPSNPLGVRAIIYTIVTPDLTASIHFYRNIMGFELISQGKLGVRPPKMEGVGEPGRAYALIRTMEPGEEHGIWRRRWGRRRTGHAQDRTSSIQDMRSSNACRAAWTCPMKP